MDTSGSFDALPTPVRLDADSRFNGRGVTIALVDAAFHPHPDLVRPRNRIRVWADASRNVIQERWYERHDVPVWPEMPPEHRAAEWHGLMTSVTAAGNGWLSEGRYRALASESEVALVSVSTGEAISSTSIARALRWLRRHALELRLRVVSLSVAGDEPVSDRDNEIDDEVEALVADGVVVVAAAGNDGIRRLLPPATAPDAITVGGLDDHNSLERARWELWHSNFGTSRANLTKPEVLAPSMWTIAPVLPGSEVARESKQLFGRRREQMAAVEHRIAQLKLVSPYYQHVEGTSVAAPIVASVVACMIEADRDLTPETIKSLLRSSGTRVPGAPERQGAGAVHARRAVADALARHRAERRQRDVTRASSF